MTDIVERLRRWSVFGYGVEASSTMKEAATEIEHQKTVVANAAKLLSEQTAEIERLRAALREIESITVHSGGDIHGVHPSFWEVAFKQAQDTARAALGGEDD